MTIRIVKQFSKDEISKINIILTFDKRRKYIYEKYVDITWDETGMNALLSKHPYLLCFKGIQVIDSRYWQLTLIILLYITLYW